MSRFSASELDEIKARRSLAEVAGEHTKLRKLGGRIVGACPFCGGKEKSSARFEIKDKGKSWVCANCQEGGDIISFLNKAKGLNFRDAIDWLGGAGVVPDPEKSRQMEEENERKRVDQEKVSDQFREAERKRLWATWKATKPIHGTIAARYLEGRGLRLPGACPGLRFLPEAPYFHGEEVDDRGRKSPVILHKGPAMVAAFIRPDGKFGGLHLTFLTNDDPPVKISLFDPETGEMLTPKKMRGSKRCASILFAGTAVSARRMVIGEGIETVGSVWTAFDGGGRDISDMAFWTAGDLGNLAGPADGTIQHPTAKQANGRAQRLPGPLPDFDKPGLSIPDSVEELILLGDGDSEPLLTECAMERAARRYAREGRTIRIAFAPAGRDFNDLLRGEAA